jgi:hypothetical protein
MLDRLRRRVNLMFDLGLVYIVDHEVRPWKTAFFHSPTSVVQLL